MCRTSNLRLHLHRSELISLYLDRAFSTIVAENQFATLGIVLLSTLARLAKATGLNLERDSKPQSKNKQSSTASSCVDRGERVSRDEANTPPLMPSKARQSVSEAPSKSTDDKASAKRSKKSNTRKKNAIDDIFSSLL